MAWDSDSDDDFDIPVIAKKKEWADEDAAPAPAPAAPAPAPATATRDPSLPLRPKEIAKQRKRAAAARRAAEAEEVRKRLEELKPLDDPVAERMRRKKLVEEADHALTAELFEEEKNDPIVKPILSLPLETAADFERAGNAVARRLNAGENSANTMRFFAGLIGATEEALDANDIREVVKLLNQLRNAKIKAASAAKKKGKKKKKTKAKMSMATDDDWMTAQANDDDYDDGDDYDFI